MIVFEQSPAKKCVVKLIAKGGLRLRATMKDVRAGQYLCFENNEGTCVEKKD